MNQHYSLAAWLATAVILVGIASLVLLGVQPVTTTNGNAAPTPSGNIVGLLIDQTGLLTITNNSTLTTTDQLTPFATATLLPTPTPIPPLLLPNAPAPEGGEVYLLQPISAEAVGWVQDQDETVNHFGDYNIYAGVFEGHQRIGAIQFDLSTIPPGAPIVYADLTLTGLSDEWLGAEGAWQAELLAPWIDQDWAKRNFHWLARPDSALAALTGQVSQADVGVGQFNTFFFSPEALNQLAARLYTGQLAVRLVGPNSGSDNLFAWDSGFGAQSSGRSPVLRIVTSGPAPATPPPSPTPAYVVITLTPTDDRAVLAQAAERMTATALAPPLAVTNTITATATATPFPPNWVTPVVIANTPVPENAATAAWQEQVATAQALVRGTATATPPNVWTATSTPGPTATPIIVAYERLTATPTPTGTPMQLPAFLLGKILFWSDRTGNKAGSLMLMNPDGSDVAVWTGGPPQWVYRQARHSHEYSPDGRYRVVVSSEQVRTSQLWIVDLTNGARRQLTDFQAIAYDPVWSPTGNRIAFVSPEPGNDELFVINSDGSGLTQLTQNDWEWDKYPSWSPDGQQLVFWSNRWSNREESTRQIWVMHADGSNLRNLSNNNFNDWEPVWVTSLAIDPNLDLEKK